MSRFLHLRFFIPAILSLQLISCFSHSPSDKMRNTRIHWDQYFIASLDLSKKQLALGTDSMLVSFENRSDYKMDSAFILFQNQGLFVHHMDTIKVSAVPAKGKIAVPPPLHSLGLVRSVKIIAIYSKALEFRYKADIVKGDDEEDCFHCK